MVMGQSPLEFPEEGRAGGPSFSLISWAQISANRSGSRIGDSVEGIRPTP